MPKEGGTAEAEGEGEEEEEEEAALVVDLIQFSQGEIKYHNPEQQKPLKLERKLEGHFWSIQVYSQVLIHIRYLDKQVQDAMDRPWPWKPAQEATVSSAVKFIYSEQSTSIVAFLLVNHFCLGCIPPT